MQPGCCRWFPCFRSNLHVEGAVPETLKLPSDIEQVFARPNGEQSRRALEFDWLKKEKERERDRESSIEDAQVSKLVLKQPNNLGLLLGL